MTFYPKIVWTIIIVAVAVNLAMRFIFREQK
jgi:hypothetical protein